jgi:hypothetical protein
LLRRKTPSAHIHEFLKALPPKLCLQFWILYDKMPGFSNPNDQPLVGGYD